MTAIAAGSNTSFYIKSDGSLWATGYNREGQFGNGDSGSYADRMTFQKVVNSGVTAITAGSHSLYLKSDGSLWATGSNNQGQLGNGNTTSRTTFQKVVNSGVTAIAAGDTRSLYIKSNGSLWGMGYNSGGVLGDGTTTNRTSPVQIVDSNVTAINTMESNFSLFLKSDGSLWAMGNNGSGQFGARPGNNSYIPVSYLNLIRIIEQPYVAETAADVTDD